MQVHSVACTHSRMHANICMDVHVMDCPLCLANRYMYKRYIVITTHCAFTSSCTVNQISCEFLEVYILICHGVFETENSIPSQGVRDLNLNYRISSSTELYFDPPNLSTLDKLSLNRFLCNFVILSQSYSMSQKHTVQSLIKELIIPNKRGSLTYSTYVHIHQW